MKKTYQVRMRELSEDHDLTQKEVAGVLGILQQTYARYETGERALPIWALPANNPFAFQGLQFNKNAAKTRYFSPPFLL